MNIVNEALVKNIIYKYFGQHENLCAEAIKEIEEHSFAFNHYFTYMYIPSDKLCEGKGGIYEVEADVYATVGTAPVIPELNEVKHDEN